MVGDETERETRIAILCEAIWVLNNLTHDNSLEVDGILFLDYDINTILLTHLKENFIPEAENQSASSINASTLASESHYRPPVDALKKYELDLLENIVWFIANLEGSPAISFAFANDHLAELLYLMTDCYHQQFSEQMWGTIIWTLLQTSNSFPLFDDKSLVDINPYYNFLAAFTDTIIDLIFSNEPTLNLLRRESAKNDFVMLVSNAFNYFGENEKLYFTNAPYKLAEALTF